MGEIGRRTLNRKEIKKRAWKTTFGRGKKAYLSMVFVLFIFSFLSIMYSSGTDEIGYIDMMLGVGSVNQDDVEEVRDYIVAGKIFNGVPENIKEELLTPMAEKVVTAHPLVLKALMTNHDYVERNMSEVVAIIVIGIIVLGALEILVTRPLLVGEYRYMMEARFASNVKFRRLFAPFGNKRFWKVFLTMTCYNFIMLLWWLSIVGGVYKHYQYYFVRNIVAENPDVKWRQARDLSKAMTQGYKFKIFTLQLSYWYLLLVGLLPFLDLFITIPVRLNAMVDIYFLLRNRDDIDKSLFIERAFDEKPFVERVEAGEDPEDINPEYVLQDVSFRGSSYDQNDKYSIKEFIVMFFLFSFVGWVWEVGIHIYEDHVFVNRGTMYGPWLPIYGAGGAFIIVFLSRFKNNKPKLFILTMVLCGILEYATSFYLEFFNNSKYWDYNDMFGNLNGRVCLAGLLAFALGGFLGIYILGPLIKQWIAKLGNKKTTILCVVLVTAFLIDFICCRIFGANAGAGVGEKYSLLINYLSV